LAELRNIVVFLEAGSPCDSQRAMAVALAAQNGAALTAVCAFVEPDMDPPDGWAIGPEGVGDVIVHRKAAIDRLLAPIESAFRAACAAADVACVWIAAAPGEATQDLALRARCFDLAITPQPRSRDEVGRRLAEVVALTSGTPCLVVPEGNAFAPPFGRVLAAWNGSLQAKHALDAAGEFLQAAAAVRLVTVDGDGPEADEAEILTHLRRHGIMASFERVDALHGDAGATLLERCRQFGAELLVMGAFGHSRAAEMILGGATRTVLADMTLPVLLSH
jgi:nucleotide-binding universal stress UspA family protein